MTILNHPGLLPIEPEQCTLKTGILIRQPGIMIIADQTIYLWEHNRVQPSLAQIPKIIEFLGCDPYEEEAENIGDKIREYRRIHGLTQKKLAEQLGVDQTTLAAWERRSHTPSKRLLNKLIAVISFSQSKDTV